jgi:SAM-dependent methyltransferase
MLRARRYGLDAPGVVSGLAAGGLASAGAQALVPRLLTGRPILARVLRGYLGLSAVASLGQAAYMVASSLVGKQSVWRGVLDGLDLPPDAQVLELGPGRGWLLVEVAERLGPAGHITGIDLWRTRDQAGNSRAATEANLAAAGVLSQVTLVDGDFASLPFPDASFDVAFANLAIHNLSGDSRRDAVREMARVLRPGARAVIVDFQHTAAYADLLAEAGLAVRRSHADLRMWPPVRSVTATRIGVAAHAG